jgi:hypothetical protein
VTPHAKASLDVIRGLDPVADYRVIYDRLLFVDAASTMAAGLNLAFYRSFAAPRIATLLAGTRVAIDEPVQRASDTAVLIWEMVMHGFDHERGRAALKRMNRIHSAFPIADEDYLYVLSAIVVVPIRFMDRYGWRRAFEHERIASAEFYRQMGRLMGVRGIPADFAEFEAYMQDYERVNFVFSDEARELIAATTSLMDHRVPKPLRGAVGMLTSTLMDRRMRNAAGVRNPPPGLSTAVRLAARTSSRIARRRNPHPAHRFPDGVVVLPTYPDGYRIEQVGHCPERAADQPGHPVAMAAGDGANQGLPPRPAKNGG